MNESISLTKNIVKDLNTNHAVVMLGGKFAILLETINPATGLDEIQFSRVGDIRNLYRNKKIATMVNDKIKMINPADIWLDHKDRRQFKGIVFTPLEPPDGYYNLWRGFAVEPKKGNCKLYKDHIFQNICSSEEEHFEWLTDWMADAVQNPAERPGTAVVLRGPQGTGKGVFATQFGKIYGSHFVHISGQHRLTGKFNNHLKMGLLVFVDEGFWAGDRRDAGTLKAMITEETLLIEPKFQDAVPLRNHLRVIMASNNDWVIPADLEERRFFVLDVCDQCRMDTTYFGAIVKEMENGGRAALLYELLERSIGSNLREIPRTQALYDQMVTSMGSLKKWWLSCLYASKITSDNDEWPSKLSAQDTYDTYITHCSKEKLRHPVTYAHFFRKLHRLCPGIVRRRPGSGSNREYFLYLPHLEQVRKAFEDRIRIVINWDEDQVPF
jgi:hypothetical protein